MLCLIQLTKLQESNVSLLPKWDCHITDWLIQLISSKYLYRDYCNNCIVARVIVYRCRYLHIQGLKPIWTVTLWMLSGYINCMLECLGKVYDGSWTCDERKPSPGEKDWQQVLQTLYESVLNSQYIAICLLWHMHRIWLGPLTTILCEWHTQHCPCCPCFHFSIYVTGGLLRWLYGWLQADL